MGASAGRTSPRNATDAYRRLNGEPWAMDFFYPYFDDMFPVVIIIVGLLCLGGALALRLDARVDRPGSWKTKIWIGTLVILGSLTYLLADGCAKIRGDFHDIHNMSSAEYLFSNGYCGDSIIQDNTNNTSTVYLHRTHDIVSRDTYERPQGGWTSPNSLK